MSKIVNRSIALDSELKLHLNLFINDYLQSNIADGYIFVEPALYLCQLKSLISVYEPFDIVNSFDDIGNLQKDASRPQHIIDFKNYFVHLLKAEIDLL